MAKLKNKAKASGISYQQRSFVVLQTFRLAAAPQALDGALQRRDEPVKIIRQKRIAGAEQGRGDILLPRRDRRGISEAHGHGLIEKAAVAHKALLLNGKAHPGQLAAQVVAGGLRL